MRDIKDRLQRKALLSAFLNKSFFNSAEVNYLSVFYEGKFHVFKNSDVISALAKNLIVENSDGEQKVVMKFDGNNVAELEMRTDGKHFVRVRFNAIIPKVVALLQKCIEPPKTSKISKNIYVYGVANKTFGKWIFADAPADETDMNERLKQIGLEEETKEVAKKEIKEEAKASPELA